jgi:hypothetical protein
MLFAGGYLLVWSTAGVAAYALFEVGKNCPRVSLRGTGAEGGSSPAPSWPPLRTSSRR